MLGQSFSLSSLDGECLPIESLFIWAFPNLWGLYQGCLTTPRSTYSKIRSLCCVGSLILSLKPWSICQLNHFSFGQFQIYEVFTKNVNHAVQKFTHTILNISTICKHQSTSGTLQHCCEWKFQHQGPTALFMSFSKRCGQPFLIICTIRQWHDMHASLNINYQHKYSLLIQMLWYENTLHFHTIM